MRKRYVVVPSVFATVVFLAMVARLFVQPQQNGPLWYSAVGSPVEVKIVSIEEQTLTAELVGGTLENTTTGQTGVTGTFQGILP